MRIFTIAVAVIISFYSCQNQDKGELLIGTERLKGQIVNDSILDGRIQIYDIGSNRLKAEKNYKMGILDGPFKLYNEKRMLSYSAVYKNDMLDGYRYFFDDSGNLSLMDYYYSGLRVGPSVSFKRQQPGDYFFNSLDGELLMHLNYDSLKTKRYYDQQEKFFFYHLRSYKELSSDSLSKAAITECFLYLPNPPGFCFKYDLVIKDKTGNIVKDGFNSLESNRPWTVFSIDSKQLKNSTENFFLELEITDSSVMKKAWSYRQLFL